MTRPRTQPNPLSELDGIAAGDDPVIAELN